MAKQPFALRPRLLISRSRIQRRVRELAHRINLDYYRRKPIFLGVLKGAFVFLADLIRHLDGPLECDFVRLSSYGTKKISSGRIKLRPDIFRNLKGRNVIIVEDIVDTGRSTNFLIKQLKRHSPRTLRLCALLDKPSRRLVKVRIDYRGFRVPDKFIVGYGLDYNEQYRQLPYIGYIPDKR